MKLLEIFLSASNINNKLILKLKKLEANKMALPKGSLWLRAQLGIPPLLLLAMALAGGSETASAEAFDSVLGDTGSCHRACQLMYPLHTYPKEEELYACQRGCRLFSICQFVMMELI